MLCPSSAKHTVRKMLNTANFSIIDHNYLYKQHIDILVYNCIVDVEINIKSSVTTN